MYCKLSVVCSYVLNVKPIKMSKIMVMNVFVSVCFYHYLSLYFLKFSPFLV